MLFLVYVDDGQQVEGHAKEMVSPDFYCIGWLGQDTGNIWLVL